MSTVPYLPAGVESLPANRYVIFADGQHKIQRIDESALTKDGASFVSVWESPLLNREMLIATLGQLYLLYSALAATTLTVKGSKDGGATWEGEQTVVIELTAVEQLKIAIASFDITGTGLRFRLEFDTDLLVNVFGYRPVLIDRGDLLP